MNSAGKSSTPKPKPNPGRRPEAKKKKPAQHKTSDTVRAILIALLAALVLRQFVIASYNVPTGSMKDTIMVGDFMFVNKFIYGVRTPIWIGIPFSDMGFYLPEWLHFQSPGIDEPEPTDIVVFDYPRDRKIDYIKRCIAQGGQTIAVRHDTVYVNGRPEGEARPLGQKYDRDEIPGFDNLRVQYTQITAPNDRSYTIRHFVNVSQNKKTIPVTILPAGHFFMMGDNRDNSQDSREWGFVPRDHIVGKPLMIWLSWNSSDLPAYRFYDKIRWDRLGSLLR